MVNADVDTLSQRLHAKQILVAPGVYDALTAVVAERSGFEMVFLSGSAVAASQFGRPDVGLVTMSEMGEILERIADRISIPIFVDADSGFGNAIQVARTVRGFERAGAAAIQIEDQINTKSMSEIGKHPLIAKEAMVGKVKAALDARTKSCTLISARTDAVFTEGTSLALERAHAYADAGADIVFMAGLMDASDLETAVRQLSTQVFLLFNRPSEDGPSPARLERLGFSIVLFPATVLHASVNAVWQAMQVLADKKGPELSTVTASDFVELN